MGMLGVRLDGLGLEGMGLKGFPGFKRAAS